MFIKIPSSRGNLWIIFDQCLNIFRYTIFSFQCLNNLCFMKYNEILFLLANEIILLSLIKVSILIRLNNITIKSLFKLNTHK